MSLLAKVNVWDVVRAHWRTLYDLRTGRRSFGDVALFFVFPTAAAALLVRGGSVMTTDGVNVLLTCLSIFVGLLFNLLVLAHAMRGGERARPRTGFERQLLREINTNLEFAILGSLTAICLLLVTVLAPSTVLGPVPASGPRLVVPWLSGVVYAFSINFVLTLFMVLKRMHTLLWAEYDDIELPAKEPIRIAREVGPASQRPAVPPVQIDTRVPA